MKPESWQPGPRPLFFKLFLFFLLSCLAVMALVPGIFWMFGSRHRPGRAAFEKNMAFHFEHLIQLIGDPPDKVQALQLCRQLDTQMEIQDADGVWFSEPGLENLKLFQQPTQAALGYRIGHVHERPFFIVTQAGRQYLFFYSGQMPVNFPWEGVALLLGAILFILFLSFGVTRRMLAPVRLLMSGVSQLSSGNLDYQIEVRQRGEFRYLAETFNSMARRIKDMVESQVRLLRDVSHELRSPLTRLRLALEMSPQGKFKQSALQDVAEMESLLAEILQNEQLRSGNARLQKRDVNLTAEIKALAEKYKGRKPGVKLVELPSKAVVQADPLWLGRVLGNVLENALKYSQEQHKAVEVKLQEGPMAWTWQVRDFGQGIPAEEQEKVFEPFYRLDPSRSKNSGGYGLGLSLCREVLKAHGGKIWLESQVGEGTTVYVELPK